MLQFLEEQATLHIVQAGKTILPSRDQPIMVHKENPQNGSVYTAM
jgi:hypothetical protein